jgi:hypothetical protein
VLLTDYPFEEAYGYEGEKSIAPDGWYLRTLEELKAYTEEWMHLPGSTKRGEGRRSLGKNTTWLTEKLEEAYLHIFALNERIKVLEGNVTVVETPI